MKYKIYKSLILIIILTSSAFYSQSQELSLIKSLNGTWRFSIGDNASWSKPDFNDENWDEIYAPSNWESQGYKGYNGFAWYRKTINISEIDEKRIIILNLGKIDDVDQVFINGILIGQTGKFHPNFKPAYFKERKYVIPNGILKFDEENVISIRVFDSFSNGGIISRDIGFYYDITNELLEINLSGEWQFALSSQRDNPNPKLSKLDWTTIKVPAYWEDEGYAGYDGFAVYSKKVVISQELSRKDLVLVLGKIDDYDYVYFNGKLIGKVFDLREESAYNGNGNEYSAFRGYKIPENLIKANESNAIIVKVYDYFQNGGIYEGPIGIMTNENFQDLKRKHYNSYPTFWDLIFN